MKKEQVFFSYAISATALFFFGAVLPAMNFDDKLRETVMHVGDMTKVSEQSLSQKFQNTENLKVYNDNQKIVLEFFRPHYVFLYVNKEAEKEFQKMLPSNVIIKVKSETFRNI